MKKTYLMLEFAAVFIFLLLPPLFASGSSGSLDAQKSFCFPIFVELLIAVALEAQSVLLKSYSQNTQKSESKSEQSGQKKTKIKRFITCIFYTTLCTGLLFLSLALTSALQYFFKDKNQDSYFFINGNVSFFDIIFLAVNFLCAAFYEEAIYRHFTVDSLKKIFSSKKIAAAFFEIFAILIFAFAHRAQGIFGIMHAAVSAVILRFCFVKTRSVYAGCAAHFIHNIILLAFAILI